MKFLRSIVDDIVTKLQKEYNLTESVVNDFERYMNNVAVVIKGLQEKGTVPTDKQSYVKHLVINLAQ